MYENETNEKIVDFREEAAKRGKLFLDWESLYQEFEKIGQDLSKELEDRSLEYHSIHTII